MNQKCLHRYQSTSVVELGVLKHMLCCLAQENKLQGSHGKDVVIMCNFEMNMKDKQEHLLFIPIKLLLRTVFIFNHCCNFWMFCLPKKGSRVSQRCTFSYPVEFLPSMAVGESHLCILNKVTVGTVPICTYTSTEAFI